MTTAAWHACLSYFLGDGGSFPRHVALRCVAEILGQAGMGGMIPTIPQCFDFSGSAAWLKDIHHSIPTGNMELVS
jgi:hypothetical protein